MAQIRKSYTHTHSTATNERQASDVVADRLRADWVQITIMVVIFID